MDLTWVAAGSLLLTGTGYAIVRRGNRVRLVCWSLVCWSLFALATRDLFRPRERGRPARPARQQTPDRPSDGTAGDATWTRLPLVERLRKRFAGWLD